MTGGEGGVGGDGDEVGLVLDPVGADANVVDLQAQVIHPLLQLGDRVEGLLSLGIEIEAGVDVDLWGRVEERVSPPLTFPA